MDKPNWTRAKHLLAEIDGAATEILVVGLTLDRWSAVVTAVGELPSLEVTGFDDSTLEHPEPFDAAWRSRFASVPLRSGHHSLRSAAEELQIHLWVDAATATFEVELVFWNDVTFPPGLAIAVYARRFDTLVSLAERCRVGARGAKCILTPEHNGPTAELLAEDRAHVVVW